MSNVFIAQAKAHTLARVLPSKVIVAPAYLPEIAQVGKYSKPYIAIWDTGATCSAITERLVKDLDLKTIGGDYAETVGGRTFCNHYYVNITLPNDVEIRNIEVVEGKICGRADVLIGMDIISGGDFIVTNKNGRTKFSFCYPSTGELTYHHEDPPQSNQILKPEHSKKIGRNDPCWCDSGLKYKKCHGK